MRPCPLCLITVLFILSLGGFAQTPGPAPGPGPTTIGCKCEFTTFYTDSGNPPPDCIQSWGVTYTSEDGICKKNGCPPEKKCKADVTMSMTADDESCETAIVVTDSETGQSVAAFFDGSFSVPYTFNISCGEHVTLEWGAEGISLGSTELTCNDCEDEEQDD